MKRDKYLAKISRRLASAALFALLNDFSNGAVQIPMLNDENHENQSEDFRKPFWERGVAS